MRKIVSGINVADKFQMQMVSTRTFENGCVALHYQSM
jgi:hypothetical protein